MDEVEEVVQEKLGLSCKVFKLLDDQDNRTVLPTLRKLLEQVLEAFRVGFLRHAVASAADNVNAYKMSVLYLLFKLEHPAKVN